MNAPKGGTRQRSSSRIPRTLSPSSLVVHPSSPEALQPKLHLGCGQHVVPGWINIDGSWNARLAKYPRLRSLLRMTHLAPGPLIEAAWSAEILTHDVRKRLPFSDGSVSMIYASHLVEHLYLSDAKRLLNECFRVLQPGGVIRLVVPDLAQMVDVYIQAKTGPDAATAADRLNSRLLFRSPDPPKGPLPYRAYTIIHDFHSHKWMYDAPSMARHLNSAGFVEVAQHRYRESRISGIEHLEQPDRVLNGEGICLEGIKRSEGI